MRSDLTSEIAIKLIEGEFICQYVSPTLFNELNNDDGLTRQEIETFLAVAGRNLSTDDKGTTFFATYPIDAPEAKKEAEKLFDALRVKIRPLLDFFNLMAEISGHEKQKSVYIQGGEIISQSQVIAAIEHNEKLKSDLNQLVTKETSPSLQVKYLFTDLVKDGLLVQKDSKSDRYIVTGKTDFLQEALLFICDMENIVNEVEDNLKNKQVELI